MSVQVQNHGCSGFNIQRTFQRDIPAQLDGAAGIDRRLQVLKGGHAAGFTSLCNGYGDSAKRLGRVDCRTADVEVCGSGGSVCNLCAFCCGKVQNVVVFGAAGFGEGTDYTGNIGGEVQSGVQSDIGMIFDGDGGGVVRPAAFCRTFIGMGNRVPCALRCGGVRKIHRLPHKIYGDFLVRSRAGNKGTVYGDFGVRGAVIRCRKGCDGQGQRYYKRKNN